MMTSDQEMSNIADEFNIKGKDHPLPESQDLSAHGTKLSNFQAASGRMFETQISQKTIKKYKKASKSSHLKDAPMTNRYKQYIKKQKSTMSRNAQNSEIVTPTAKA